MCFETTEPVLRKNEFDFYLLLFTIEVDLSWKISLTKNESSSSTTLMELRPKIKAKKIFGHFAFIFDVLVMDTDYKIPKADYIAMMRP